MPELKNLFDKLVDKLNTWVESFVIMLPNLVLALLVVLISVPVARWLDTMVERLLLRVTRNKQVSSQLSTVARITVVLVALFFALGLLELDKTVTSLLAGVGVLGLALGFAFQDIAANFMSGFMMAFYRPFRVGDLVEVAGHQGRILNVAMRATELETLDGRSVLVPNKEIFSNPIENYTRTPARRLEFHVGTAYCDDMAQVQRVIISALANLSNRESSREVEVLFEEFGDSSIVSSVLVWLAVSDQISYRRARSEAMIAIKSAFDREGITIPFPIRTLDFGAKVVGGERLDALQLSMRSAAQRELD